MGSNVSVGADVSACIVATVVEFISGVESIGDVDGSSGIAVNQPRSNNYNIANARMINPKNNCW